MPSVLRVRQGDKIIDIPAFRGEPGFSPKVKIEKSEDDSVTLSITDVDGTTSVNVTDTFHQYVETAKDCALKAEQAAEKSGYMNFYINEDGRLLYRRTENVSLNFAIENGRLIICEED